MNDPESVFAMLIMNLLVSSLVALLGRNRKIGYLWSFVLCFFVSPLIAVIVIRNSKKKDDDFIEVRNEYNEKESNR